MTSTGAFTEYDCISDPVRLTLPPDVHSTAAPPNPEPRVKYPADPYTRNGNRRSSTVTGSAKWTRPSTPPALRTSTTGLIARPNSLTVSVGSTSVYFAPRYTSSMPRADQVGAVAR